MHNPEEDEPIGEYVDKDGNDIVEMYERAEAKRDELREDGHVTL